MNDERVDEIFGRIEEMDIELDDDPIQRGPKYLNNMVAKCRNYITEVERYSREVSKEIRKLERKLHIEETKYELKYDDLLANDPDIIEMRKLSKSDREAAVRTKLRDRIERINCLEEELTSLKPVEKLISAKLKELRAVNRDIRLQRKIIDAEIDAGAYWGNDNNMDSQDQDTNEIADDLVEMTQDEIDKSEEEGFEDIYELSNDESDDKSLDMDENDGINDDSKQGELDQDPKLDEMSEVEEDDIDFDFDSVLSKME